MTLRSPIVLALTMLCASAAEAQESIAYRLLATSKTGTMQKEMNEAAEAGYKFVHAMGGDTAMGGNEVVVVMARKAWLRGRYSYQLLAASKTSTMEKELQQAADAGFEYREQTVFKSAFGGNEVVVILERNDDAPSELEYKLLATSKTGTMQKELTEAGARGFELVAVAVGKTAVGGNEVVAITQRRRQQ